MNRVFAWPVGPGRKATATLEVSGLYASASLLGGALLGTILGTAAVMGTLLPEEPLFLFLACAAFAAVVLEALGSLAFLPQRRGQVPREWLVLGNLPAAGLFGLALGFGATTWLRHAAAYAGVVGILASGSFSLALAAGLTFGGVRGVQPLAFRVLAATESTGLRLERFLAGNAFALSSRVVLATLASVILVDIADRI